MRQVRPDHSVLIDQICTSIPLKLLLRAIAALFAGRAGFISIIDEPMVTAVSGGDGYIEEQAERVCPKGRWKYAMLPIGVVEGITVS